MKHMLFAPSFLLSIAIFLCSATSLLALTDFDTGSLAQRKAVSSGSEGVFAESMGFEKADALSTNSTSITWNSELERQGVILGLLGLHQEALEKFNEAIRINPEQSSVYAKIGDILYYTGKTEESEKYYNLAIYYDKNNRFAHQRLGIIAESKGKIQEAIDHYEKGLIGATDRYLGTRLNLAQCYILAKKYDNAIQLLEKYKSSPIFTDSARLVLASAYLGTEQFEEAIRLYDHILSKEPNSLPALTSLGIAHRIIGNKDKSLFHLNKALEIAPNDPLALFQRAETLRAHGDAPAAIRDYLHTEGGWMENAANQRLIDMRKSVETQKTLDKEIDAALQASSKPKPFLRSAVIYFEAGQAEKSLSILESLTKTFSKQPGALFEAGSMLAAFKHYDRAREAYELALRSAPTDEKILKALIMVHMRQNNTTEAVELASKLIRGKHYNESDSIFAATIFQDAGRVDLASPLYETVLEHNPDNIIALNNLASILTSEKNFTRAIPLAKKAYELAENSSAVQDTLGWALVQAGEAAQGLLYLQKALDQHPTNPVYLYHLGVAKEALSKGTGMEHIKNALQISQDFPGSEDARRIVGQ